MIKSVLTLCLMLWTAGASGKEPVYLGLDAEFGHKTSTSAQAVLQGMEVAVEEINQAGGVLGGRPLEILVRDNRSITAVGLDNLRELSQIPGLVAVFGGKFSPIYIESLPLVHELGIPLMDPWGSADLITDHHYRPSFTFRLSIKDAWVGPAFVRFAREHYRAQRLGVLLPNTAWGRSNKSALENAVASASVQLVGHHWYNWGDASLIQSYQQLRNAGAQVIVLIANETDGSVLVKEVAALPVEQRLPILSHWGVTGGNFHKMSGDALGKVDFAVVQSYSFLGQDGPAARRVLNALKRRYGIASASFVQSPVGVAHAYDLTHLVARAVNKAGSTDKVKVRDALETLGSYDGLVRRLGVPFTRTRHDALSSDVLFFARYAMDGQLIPITKSKKK
jgi:branched-chain amino acid transport system substrate-binding protein